MLRLSRHYVFIVQGVTGSSVERIWVGDEPSSRDSLLPPCHDGTASNGELF